MKPILGAIKMRYGLAVLEPLPQGRNWFVHGEVQRAVDATSAEVAGAATSAPGRKVTAYQGTNGDAILAIIQSGMLNPGDGRIFLVRTEFSRGFTHGGDTKRGAAFVIEVEATIPESGASEVRTSTPGVRDTLRIDTDKPLAVEVKTLHVRTPVFEEDEEPAPGRRRKVAGYEFHEIRGASAISDFLTKASSTTESTGGPPGNPPEQTAAERDWDRARAAAEQQQGTTDLPGRTEHGALREQERGGLTDAERGRLGQATPRRQADGAIARVLREGGGGYTVVITNETGAVVTVIRNKSKAELRRLSENYSWDPPYE